MGVISRKNAKTVGLLRYFTGKPCKYGHIAERLVSNGNCLDCVASNKNEKDRAYRLRHLDKIRAKDRARGRRPMRDRTLLLAQKRRHYVKHRESILEKSVRYRTETKEERAAYFKRYKKENSGKVNAINKQRDLAKKNRTPAWLTEDDLWMMEEIYTLAALRTAATGISWHVDHIIPLRGKTVSGLHVPSNLQVITGAENVRKNNRWGVDNG